MQARSLYRGVDANGTEKAFLGPMCFSELPPVPPPPPPPPAPVAFALQLVAAGEGLSDERARCLMGEAALKKPLTLTLSASCAGAAAKQWSLASSLSSRRQAARPLSKSEGRKAALAEEGRAAAGMGAAARSHHGEQTGATRWLAWGHGPRPFYVKVDEAGVNGTMACQRGHVYTNPDEGSVAHQGFSAVAVTTFGGSTVKLASSLCEGMCLDVTVAPGRSVVRLGPCVHAATFSQVEVHY